jgi:hypothetical protein
MKILDDSLILNVNKNLLNVASKVQAERTPNPTKPVQKVKPTSTRAV